MKDAASPKGTMRRLKGLVGCRAADGVRGAFASWPTAAVGLCILAGWLVGVCLMSARHEPWGDEVRALTLATEVHHWWQLPEALRNEGHPVLWYLILRSLHGLWASTVILKVASVAVAFLSVCLLFWRAPFPLWWKTLFAFSFLPFYEYSVMARNYGITMLLAFAFAAAYPLRKRQPYFLALLLVLLANSNVHSLALAALFLGIWLWDEVFAIGPRNRLPGLRPLALPASLVIISGLGAVLTCLPESGYLPPGVKPLTWAQALGACWTALVHPGASFPVLLPFPDWMRDGVVWGLLAGLLPFPPGLLALWGFDLFLQVLFLSVYPGGLRHQGLLMVGAVAVYWVAADRELAGGKPRKGPVGTAGRVMSQASILALVPLLFLLHIWLSRGPISLDWTHPFSSNKALSSFLEADPALRRAILVPEPDYFLESLPYYCDNPIYFPRQQGFDRRVRFTPGYQRDLTLGQLMDEAKALETRFGVPVLIVWGHPALQTPGAGKVEFPGGRVFRWTDAESAVFLRSTRRVASFMGALSNENYNVFLLTR